MTSEGVIMAIRAGVNTLEHASAEGYSDDMFIAMRDNHTILVPTLAILEKLQPAHLFANICSNVKWAHDLSVRIAFGGDTGTFSHGENAREIELMCGIPSPDVLEACTVGGWEACGARGAGGGLGGSRRFARRISWR